RRGGTGLTAAVALADWCAVVIGRPPVAVRPAHLPAAGHAGWLLDFGAGQAAQVMTWQAGGGSPRWQLRVVAERGSASVRLPGRLCWDVGDGRHAHDVARP